MKDIQEDHLKDIKDKFCYLVDAKYRKGAEEHGTILSEEPIDKLIDFAIEEAIDQVTYLLTIKEQRDKEQK